MTQIDTIGTQSSQVDSIPKRKISVNKKTVRRWISSRYCSNLTCYCITQGIDIVLATDYRLQEGKLSIEK